MTGIATGVFKRLYVKRQASLGVVAPAGAAGSAQSMRRVTSTIDKSKANYESAEVLESQQVRDSRHGVVSVAGSITGELSVGTYQMFFESILRQLVQANVSTGPIATITAAAVGTVGGTYTRSAGSFLTDGFKIGDVVQANGFATTGVANNGKSAVITGLTAAVMTVRNLNKTPVAVKAAGDNVTILTVGKKTWVPATGQTRDYYTIEHWFSDIAVDELFRDCVCSGATIGLPPTGMATVEFPFMGINMIPGVAQYFTNPAPASAGGILASVNGVLIIDGLPVGLVTGMTITIAGNYAYPTGDGIVGSDERPDILPGVLKVTGQLTVLFQDAVYRDKFLNEEESAIAVVLTADSSAAPDFTSFVMPRVKYSGATKDDTNTGLTLTMPYTALEQVNNGGAGKPHLQTTISIQDSDFA